MSIIKINSSHRGNLDFADIQYLKCHAKEEDTVKFGSIFGKEYRIAKNSAGEVSLKQKESRSVFSCFFKHAGASKKQI